MCMIFLSYRYSVRNTLQHVVRICTMVAKHNSNDFDLQFRVRIQNRRVLKPPLAKLPFLHFPYFSLVQPQNITVIEGRVLRIVKHKGTMLCRAKQSLLIGLLFSML